MKKLLIVQDIIPHYRLPLFKAIAEKYDLTVTTANHEKSDQFKVWPIQLKKIGPFFKIDSASAPNYNDFDVVIFTFNVRWIDLLMLGLTPQRKFKFIPWGIGVSTETGFDTIKKWDWLRYIIARNSDAIIFYSDYPKERYIKNGKVPSAKIFVAHNTLDLKPILFNDPKEHFLFVGTLKKYKRVDHLIELYSQAANQYPQIAALHMIGDGDYMESLKAKIEELQLAGKVVLHGAINDPKKLEAYYRNAIASVSPAQAGLSVLQSLSMGVPFITGSNAITGGERFNIQHRYNGFLANTDRELIDALISLSKDRLLAQQMGKNAHVYFIENCSLEKMVRGFFDAIEAKHLGNTSIIN